MGSSQRKPMPRKSSKTGDPKIDTTKEPEVRKQLQIKAGTPYSPLLHQQKEMRKQALKETKMRQLLSGPSANA